MNTTKEAVSTKYNDDSAETINITFYSVSSDGDSTDSTSASSKARRLVLSVFITRVLSTLCSWCTTIILSFSLIYRPWKVELWKNHRAEFSIWDACRVTSKGEKCYKGYYDKFAPDWFWAIRYLLLMSLSLLALSTFCLLAQSILRGDRERKYYRIIAAILLSSCACLITALLLFIRYHRFEFAQKNFRYKRMGWPRMRVWENSYGYPFFMAWAALGSAIGCVVLCFFADWYDRQYTAKQTVKVAYL